MPYLKFLILKSNPSNLKSSNALSQISHTQISNFSYSNQIPQILFTYLSNPIPTSNSYIKIPQIKFLKSKSLTFSYHILLPLRCQESLRFSLLLQTQTDRSPEANNRSLETLPELHGLSTWVLRIS
ncbi:hypothetical protein ACE6H2_015500 [Prunus campanulata]